MKKGGPTTYKSARAATFDGITLNSDTWSTEEIGELPSRNDNINETRRMLTLFHPDISQINGSG